MHRVQVLANHISGAPATQVAVQSTSAAQADDVVICAAVRTPMCKGKRGAFKDTTPDVLLSTVLKAVVEKTGVNAKDIGDINVGNVLLQQSAVYARQAQALAGIPYDVPLSTVNRQCSSGIQSVANVATAIKSGLYEVGIASGVESMSIVDMQKSVNPGFMSQEIFDNNDARNCLMPMGITSENVAKKYGITREVQDQMAVESHAKAVRAKKLGLFKEEIVPVATVVKDKSGNEVDVVVSEDEGMREGLDLAALGKLRPAFSKDGTTTAGNASQVSDGAAAVLLASRAYAQRNGLPILGIFRGFSVKGCPPEIMGIGPAVAIPAVLEQANLKMSDIGIFEINEAFASQATYCVNELKVPKEKLNPKGGAIALGHPLGCTGARQVSTLLTEMKRTNQKYGVISMCIGTGMGAAAVIEKA
mmetsp:Transcript_37937/g.45738  ORF Transcript_37937/g.45738 Transcript_37937/m.45738 type:complete len:418 (-) Transcript_37937:420-1673(-)|eukprot:CAMPEP_0197864810 /NCGR_PEP_ID=MMETSP1438-20131217/43303_1 /TAXON_ID=1461541 /ORGANISM="Pterosperma sp., Strain CCMP1384" /LENGTH=417 /DNA_ID=CAMNT_0043483183 /DNA_START=83 /DNA_END=1336 /DNA_ORIENTATION=-